MSSSWKKDFPVPSADDSYATRREFTKFLGLTSIAFLLGTCAAAGRKLVKGLYRERYGSTAEVAVAGVEEMAVGGYKLFRYPTESDPCILLRLAEDRFVAFDQRCTHLSCPVYFESASRKLICPCHEGSFSVEDGRPLAGPPKRALSKLSVSTRNAKVWVQQSGQEGQSKEGVA